MERSRLSMPNQADWPYETVDSLCSIVSRGSAPVYVEHSDVMAVGQRCVAHTGFDASAARPHSAKAIDRTLSPEAGDVLLNSTGTGTIGRSVVFTAAGRFVVDGHVTLLRPRPAKADGRWLNSVLRTWWGQNFLETRCYSGSTNQVELSRTRLASAELPTPPLPEQRRIAEILDTLDEAIRKTEQIIAKLKQVKQGLLHDLLTRGIDDNGELRDPIRHPEQFKDSSLGFVPKSWRMMSLDEVRHVETPITYGVLKPGDYIAGGTPLLQIQDVIHGELDLQKVHRISASLDAEYSRTRVFGGEIVISLVGTIGRVAQLPLGLERSNLHRNLGLLRVNEEHSARFVLHSLRSSAIQRKLKDATLGTTQALLNLGGLRALQLALPGLPEQTRIAELADSADRRLGDEDQLLKKLHQIKHGLMEDLLTGQVRVPSDITAKGQVEPAAGQLGLAL